MGVCRHRDGTVKGWLCLTWRVAQARWPGWQGKTGKSVVSGSQEPDFHLKTKGTAGVTQTVLMRDNSTRCGLGQEAGVPVRGMAILGEGRWGLMTKGWNWEWARKHPKGESTGLKLMSCGCGGQRDLGWLPGWEMGGSTFFMIQENRRGSRFGGDGGKSRYRTRCLQVEVFPKHSRPAGGGSRHMYPHSASSGCKRLCGDRPSWGKAKARGAAGGELLTALNRSKLLWLICKFIQGWEGYTEGPHKAHFKESPVVMLVLPSVLPACKIKTELALEKSCLPRA